MSLAANRRRLRRNEVNLTPEEAWADIQRVDVKSMLFAGTTERSSFPFSVSTCLASESVHGNWGELIRHHFKSTERGFEPNTESSPMKRPQPFFAVGRIGAIAVVEYLQHLDSSAMRHAIEQLEDLVQRVQIADSLHEEYLQQRSNLPPQPTSSG